MTSISVVIPAYNVEDYLDQCLKSATEQTFDDIEIIIVDDASQDGTPSIINRFARDDDRISVVTHRDNESLLRTRKDGVLASCGDYVMFCDADDYLDPRACELAYHAIKEYGVDIMQFGATVENCGNVPESRIRSNQRALTPSLGEQIDGFLVSACFVERRFNAGVWNKIYKGDIVRSAYREVEDIRVQRAEDIYALFLILERARSYCAIEDKLYHYCFGRGMTGKSSISLDSFKELYDGYHVVDAIDRWCVSRRCSAASEERRALAAIRRGLINEHVGRWRDSLESDKRLDGFRHMCEVWPGGFPFVLAAIANEAYYKRAEVSGVLTRLPECTYKPRNVRTVALCYHSIYGGGAQRVVAQLANMLAGAQGEDGYRYNVVLITENGPKSEDYPISNRVVREYLPSYLDFPQRDYGDRMSAWHDILDRQSIDVLIDSMWINPIFMWDLLAIKSHKSHPAVVVHSHNCFGLAFAQSGDAIGEMCDTYRLADGVVTLSEVDCDFWSRVNRRTRYIANPVTFAVNEAGSASWSSKRVIWIARLSREKQPMHAYYAMREICRRVPEVTCHFVGDGDEAIIDELNAAIERDGLLDKVFLEGFVTDVRRWYEQSSVFIMTSEYEGYPLTLYEAAAHGLPTVMYDLPWLEYYKVIAGWDSVSMGDYQMLADRAVRLLLDRDRWEQSSYELRASYNAHAEHDILPDWLELLDSLQVEANPEDVEAGRLFKGVHAIQLDEACRFHRVMLQRIQDERSDFDNLLQRTYDEKSELGAKLQRTYDEKSELGAKLQRTYDEKAARGVQIDELNAKIKVLIAERRRLERKLRAAKEDASKLKQSRSYKVGNALVSPARSVKRRLKKLKSHLR